MALVHSVRGSSVTPPRICESCGDTRIGACSPVVRLGAAAAASLNARSGPEAGETRSLRMAWRSMMACWGLGS